MSAVNETTDKDCNIRSIHDRQLGYLNWVMRVYLVSMISFFCNTTRPSHHPAITSNKIRITSNGAQAKVSYMFFLTKMAHSRVVVPGQHGLRQHNRQLPPSQADLREKSERVLKTKEKTTATAMVRVQYFPNRRLIVTVRS